MLDIEVLETNYAVSYGSVTLKSLQNDNVPELDLLVREAIQNSSDASLGEKGNAYSVYFTTGSFVPNQFNTIMKDIEKILDERFPGDTAPFLEIRDTNTSGLTGPIKKSDIGQDDHGNFFKLIFDTGKKQINTLAGGNWGFGKSVFYRVGVGIVIYYSRIRYEGSYENRLIITLIEDESKVDQKKKNAAILNNIKQRSAGKAWWGEKQGEDLLPVTDLDTIHLILDIFKITPFQDNETGTSIIIPYLDTERLLNGILPLYSEREESVKDHFTQIYTQTIASYLRLSIQRWYAPKIHNRELEKIGEGYKWLRVFVDNVPIRKSEMISFFRLVQELYTAALAKTCACEYTSKEFPKIETLEINIRDYFDPGAGMLAGYLAVIRISKEELNDILSPYDYIGKFEAAGSLNEPVVMFARDPGMVIDYAVTGAWVKNIAPPDNPDDYLFAFFVPQTQKTIKANCEIEQFAGMSLGEYLRECETSDHMDWNDPVKMQIVQRMQKNTINKLREHWKPDFEITDIATSSKLSNNLGMKLLPRIGYGNKRPGGGGGQGGGLSSSKAAHLDFSIRSQIIQGNDVNLRFSLKLKQGKKDAVISVRIASEAERAGIDAQSWEDKIGTRFPVQIIECIIFKKEIKGKECQSEIKVGGDFGDKKVETDEISVELCSETDALINTQLKFISNIQNPEIEGVIKLNSYDKKYQFILRID